MASAPEIQFARQLGYLEIQLGGEFQDRDLGDVRQRFDRALESFRPEAEGLHHVFWAFERTRLVSENMFAALAGYMIVLRLRGARSLLIAPTRLLEGYLIRSGLDSLITSVPSEDEAFRRALEGTRRDTGGDFLDYLVKEDYLTPDQRRRVEEEAAKNPHPGVLEDVLIDAGYLTHRSLFALHHQYGRAHAHTSPAGTQGSVRGAGEAGDPLEAAVAILGTRAGSGPAGFGSAREAGARPGAGGAGDLPGASARSGRLSRTVRTGGSPGAPGAGRAGAGAGGGLGAGAVTRERGGAAAGLSGGAGEEPLPADAAPAHLAGRVKAPPPAPPPSPASEFVKPRLVGQLLVEHRLITEEQLKEALDIQRREGRDARLGDILVRCGYVKDWDIFQMLEKQHRRKDGASRPRGVSRGGGLVRSRLLGQILVDLEVLSENGLKLALVEQRKNPREKIGDILLRLNLLNRDQLLEALQVQKERAG